MGEKIIININFCQEIVREIVREDSKNPFNVFRNKKRKGFTSRDFCFKVVRASDGLINGQTNTKGIQDG